jgi:hypothetical protein
MTHGPADVDIYLQARVELQPRRTISTIPLNGLYFKQKNFP